MIYDMEIQPCCSDLRELDLDIAQTVEVAARSAVASSRISHFIAGDEIVDDERFADEARKRAQSYKVADHSEQVLACATNKALGLCVAGGEVDVEVRGASL